MLARSSAARQNNHLPLPAVFLEMNRDPPEGYPIIERQLRHFTVSLPLLITLADARILRYFSYLVL
jgi:hypothetical protein